MRSVLIVSPHFPPTDAADMHRIRLSLPYFRQFAWDPIVLAVDPGFVELIQEPLLLRTIPDSVRVQRVRAIPVRWTRKLGLRALGFRAWPFLNRAGKRILERQQVDLVYFSTTAFPVMALGRCWKERFGVPYILDMQDPWVSEPTDDESGPRQSAKHRIMREMHGRLEPFTMRKVDGIVAVSRRYHETLRERYPWIRPDLCETIPFGAATADYQVVDQMGAEAQALVQDSQIINGVYVGVLGKVMVRSCTAICFALRRGLQLRPDLYSRVRLRFIGTDYAIGNEAKQTIMPIARQMGLDQYIAEDTGRVSYFQALKLLRTADFLLMPGSTNPHYTASKLYPYVLAKRPLLALFHKSSSVVDILNRTRSGDVVTFDSTDSVDAISDSLFATWTGLLERLPFEPSTNWDEFEQYTARHMAQRQCELFDKVVNYYSTSNSKGSCAAPN